MRRAAALLPILFSVGCVSNQRNDERSSQIVHESIPPEIAQAIEKQFPGALPYHEAVDSVFRHIAHLGISMDQILWGQSICVDDITNTKNKLGLSRVKGPF